MGMNGAPLQHSKKYIHVKYITIAETI